MHNHLQAGLRYRKSIANETSRLVSGLVSGVLSDLSGTGYSSSATASVTGYITRSMRPEESIGTSITHSHVTTTLSVKTIGQRFTPNVTLSTRVDQATVAFVNWTVYASCADCGGYNGAQRHSSLLYGETYSLGTRGANNPAMMWQHVNVTGSTNIGGVRVPYSTGTLSGELREQ